MNLTRRTFIGSVVLAPISCGVPLSYERGVSVADPKPIPNVRPPQIGQEWTYIQKDVFNGKTVGVMTERVQSILDRITIERNLENGVKLDSEVQSAWGRILVDPHWSRTLTYNPSIPLWPEQLLSSWSKQFITKYNVAGYPEGAYSWQIYMSAQGWERISVPAGDFLTLRFQNLINYKSFDENNVNCIRKETIWVAPDIGRWVARESSGSYEIQGQLSTRILEDSFQWQLTSWK